jgi:deoxyadenosine/deoxycytidine kinase
MAAVPKQPFTIIVEGNIGSGKTTFLKHFKKFSQVSVVDEPVEKWRDAQGHNLFDLMYKDPVKWSFCFQSYVQLTMLDLHTKPIPVPKAVKLMERSIFSAKYCFVNNLRDQGLLADVEYTVLDEWFNFIRESVPIKVDLIVYLRTDPEIVHERISQRGRPEESAVTLDYLKSIHNLHEDWLKNKSQFVPCPVITIDANDDLASMKKNYKSCEETIFQRAAVAN